MGLIDSLKWRYATKKMNGQAVPQDKVEYILEAAKLAPSSSGVQPFKIFVITNKELREKLKIAASGQTQLTDGSHLLIWAAWNGYSDEKFSTVFTRTALERGMPENAMTDYKNSLLNAYGPLGQEWQAHHAAKQAYISFGIALAAAAEQRVDATPMEGFNNAQVDEILGLDQLGLKSVVLMPLGYRDETNDWLVNLKKVRTPEDEFFVRID
jgi:nitroreductase / dihydropteridine reductase